MRTYAMAVLGLLVAAGCPGNTIDDGNPNNPDEPDAAVEEPDAAVPDPGVKLSGKTLDYFSPTQAMDNVMLTSDGISPAMNGTSAVGGGFEFDNIPSGSSFYFSAVRTLYRPTRNAPITIAAGAPVVQDVYLMTLADVARQYSTTGNILAAGKSILAAQLNKANGTPMTGIALADITLVDALDAPVPNIKGPYVFGALGDVDPALTTTAAFGNRARIAFLDVPPGTYTLKVNYLDGMNMPKTVTTSATFVANGATIALSQPAGGGGMGMGGTPIANPTFGMHIYPMLQRASAGGLGCGNCHTATGAAAVLPYDGGATATLAAIQARLGVINLTTPADSFLLKRPLYEAPPALPDHPNATFLDINDPNYLTFLRWIQQGALP